MDLVDDLADALTRREIVAYFQPQVDVGSGRIVGGEALARWNHPVHGMLDPDLFIPAAQAHGLMDELGIFMADEAWRCAAAWAARGLLVHVAVNASATQFDTTALTDHLALLLDRYDLPAQTMTIEITETQQFSDTADAADRLSELRDKGLGISIDDFGGGFATPDRVAALPATELKIDISLVQDETDDGYRDLIEAVELAHARGLRVVAEGVEDEEQRRRVEILRCHRAQGYLFGRPMSESEFGDLLAARR